MNAEALRLAESTDRKKHWKRWGPYLADRSWGTVREDYSSNGDAWHYFPHDHARARAYRWTEDGLLGICDNHQRLCFAWALWNHADPILKERLFGLTGPEGNHGEDVKELYYYLDATPTNSYLKALYKYPQSEFPYARLVAESKARGYGDPEFELYDTGIFDSNRYFDVMVEYARNDVDDILIHLKITNRAAVEAKLSLLPQLWFRNTWTWNRSERPSIRYENGRMIAEHENLGTFVLEAGRAGTPLFTDNVTNNQHIFGVPNTEKFTKDAFHEYVIRGNAAAVNPEQKGTKAALLYELTIAPGATESFSFRLASDKAGLLPVVQWPEVFRRRVAEADEFYGSYSHQLSDERQQLHRQALAGMLWSKQFYHFVIADWLAGDPCLPQPPPTRKYGRNHHWVHLYNEDIISMPDKWEYPWYAAWDLAFHTVAIAPLDADFAKSQLQLFLREWYMHPNGQIPAYEWAFSDANPPVHPWACLKVFRIDKEINGKADYCFLERCFHKLLMNFTWWVNRKDSLQNNIFEGGFLGLDNIGVFDRNDPNPLGGTLEQSDGTAWMAAYCLTMLRIALTLAEVNDAYEDIASKFFEHFLYIADALNGTDGKGLWDERDGFYYDRLLLPNDRSEVVRIRSLVGLVPLFACHTLTDEYLDGFPGFRKRMQWFVQNRPDLTRNIADLMSEGKNDRHLLSLVKPDRLRRILSRMFDESEFLSPYGIRSLSRYHEQHPYKINVDGMSSSVRYDPAESTSGMFGGNSNWRGPVWLPMNYMLIQTLRRFGDYLGEDFQVEVPTGSGNRMSLKAAATFVAERVVQLFLKNQTGKRPIYNGSALLQDDPNFSEHILFYEYFHGDNGKGLGASHQTGWTGLVANLLTNDSRGRT